MFERFTDRARQVMVTAQAESQALGHRWIGTEHILLGVAADGDGLAAHLLADAGLDLQALRETVREEIGVGRRDDASALAAIGIDLDSVRRAAEAAFGAGALERTRSGCVPFTPRSKKALELALREAKALHHERIGTEHLLLGLAHGEGVARGLLEARGLDYRRLRALVVDALAA
jgi:ATP-dependent Clp protease ATP-binding subunit ClpA